MPSSEQGIDLNRYVVIPRTLVFITYAEKVLLIKGAATKRIWPNHFNGIGGHIERGEDPLTSARRELREETGLQVEDLWLCAVIFVDTGSKTGVGIFVYRGEITNEENLELLASKEGTLSWIPKDELNTLPLVEDLFVLLPKILELKRFDAPLSVIYRHDQDDQLVIETK